MCGFAGFLLAAGRTPNQPDALLKRMGERLRHRGPDGEGIWFDGKSGIGLSHRRLAIQDVSSFGAQPMHSASGRYVIAFNGEIYNFQELARDLRQYGVLFRGHSDTEVMLACFERWGLEKSLQQFVGMFAFVLYDKSENVLYLVRDRMGEKPLYYGWQRHDTLLFSSELHAMREHPHFIDTINRDALALLLKHNYIPAPHSIYSSVQKLEPGTCLTVRLDSKRPGGSVTHYWKAAVAYAGCAASPGREACLDEIDRLLRQSIRQQMIADVPLGAFLSGGIDSSLVVAVMQSESDRPVNTFTIGFHEQDYNEAHVARQVARHIGTDHTELYITAQDALDVVPLLPAIYDEPFADSSQRPTWLISRMARQRVTVALSGDGGDELFCGYTRYFSCMRAWQQRAAGSKLKRMLLSAMPDSVLAPMVKVLAPSQRAYSLAYIREKIARHNYLQSASTLQEYYERAICYWQQPAAVVIGAVAAQTLLADYPVADYTDDSCRQLMLLDSISYLPDDILVKVDRAAMANSLEVRIPMLDHRIVEFAARQPLSLHADGDTGKQILRSLLYRHVPQELMDRPKQGFAVPVAEWLRGTLRDWAEALLDSERLSGDGYFDTSIIRRKWQEHLSGQADHSFQLWGVLCFQAWHDHVREDVRGLTDE
jgi:asparagine synthase (glutamine-hydrolysing)